MAGTIAPKADYTLNTLNNALEILSLFLPDNKQMSFAEIQQALNLPRTTVFRLLFTLEKNGFIRKVAASGHYKLGLKFLYLGRAMLKEVDLSQISHPFMTQLRDELGETVDLTILDNDHALYIDEAVSSFHLRAQYSAMSRKLPLHCTACGKVLAAYCAKLLPHNWPPEILPAYTQNTITEPRVLMEQLAEVRKQGYAMERGELEDYVNAYSAPIFDGNHSVLAALTVVIPQSRLCAGSEEQIVAEVKKAAAKISGNFKMYL